MGYICIERVSVWRVYLSVSTVLCDAFFELVLCPVASVLSVHARARDSRLLCVRVCVCTVFVDDKRGTGRDLDKGVSSGSRSKKGGSRRADNTGISLPGISKV